MRILIAVSMPRACRKASLRLKAVTTQAIGRDSHKQLAGAAGLL